MGARGCDSPGLPGEARFEPKSYGFRPGRGCHDAIEALFNTLSGKNAKRLWVLDADLAAAFDRIDHDHLLAMLGSFPGRDLIRAWLKAGVFEKGKGFAPTEEGTPQGGVISPLLLNVALHGLEEAAGVTLSQNRSAGRDNDAGRPGAGEIRRRFRGAAVTPGSRPNRSRRGLAEWLATPGSGHQRGQDPDRAPVRRGSTSWGSTSAATEPSC